MEIRPITNDTDHSDALNAIDGLMAETSDPARVAELNAMLALVDDYERSRWPLDDVGDPISLIRQAMSEDVGHTRAELVQLIGSASRVSEILAKKRTLTLDMIRAINAAWGIPVQLLVKPYELVAAPKADARHHRSPRLAG